MCLLPPFPVILPIVIIPVHTVDMDMDTHVVDMDTHVVDMVTVMVAWRVRWEGGTVAMRATAERTATRTSWVEWGRTRCFVRGLTVMVRWDP